MEIAKDASILVRAPRWTPKWEIEQFLERQRDWILEHQRKMAHQFLVDSWTPRLTDEELKELTKAAREDIRARVDKWAPIAAPDSAWAGAAEAGDTAGSAAVGEQLSIWGILTGAAKPQKKTSAPRLTIRHQKTLWGSCTPAGNLNFNCLLMLAPEEVRDYVVVHELCHLKHMDHSRAFWRAVEKALPGYRQQRKWLKENGHSLLARLD